MHNTKTLILYAMIFTASVAFLIVPKALLAATNDTVIGVITKERHVVRLFDEEGAAVSSFKLQKSDWRYRLYTMLGNHRTLTNADIDDSSDGTEWILYRETNTVSIVQQNAGSLLYSFEAFSPTSRKHQAAAITVGEVDAHSSGPEILVCHSSSLRPKVKVFGYSSENGVTLLKTFKPFGEGQISTRGCLDLAVGDIDGDDENEIVVRKGNKRLTKIFDANGNLESQWEYAKPEWHPVPPLFLADINGDDTEDIIMLRSSVILGYSSAGELIFQLDPFLDEKVATYDQIVVGDVDGDDNNEIITMGRGRKGPIQIIDDQGESVTDIKSHPDAQYKRKRYPVIGEFAI